VPVAGDSPAQNLALDTGQDPQSARLARKETIVCLDISLSLPTSIFEVIVESRQDSAVNKHTHVYLCVTRLCGRQLL
jgi:hypothetical protein